MNKNSKYATGQIYHLFNRGVAKQPIFKDEQDYQRLLNTYAYYLEANPPQKMSEKSKNDFENKRHYIWCKKISVLTPD